MKTLVKLFIISIIIFSYSHANEKFFESLYKSEIKEIGRFRKFRDREIEKYNNMLQNPKYATSKPRLRKAMERTQGLINHNEKKIEVLKKLFKTNKKILYKQLKESYEKKYTETINRIQHSINWYKKKRVSSKIKHYTKLSKTYKNKKDELNTHYKAYLKSLQVKKISSKVLNTSKNNKLKVSTANMSKSTSKVSLKSSNLKTTVKTNNINVSNKAKASIGSVSIGKE